jgi:hypothetical protein
MKMLSPQQHSTREGGDLVWEAPAVELHNGSREQTDTAEPGLLRRIVNRISAIDTQEVVDLAWKQVAEMARFTDLVMTLGTASRVVIQTSELGVGSPRGFVIIKLENLVVISPTRCGKPVEKPFLTTVDMVVNASELQDVRLNIELVSRTGHMGAYTTLPSWDSQTALVFDCVDKIHSVLGHNAADIYESYQAINLGVMSSKFEMSSCRHDFLQAKLDSIKELKPADVYPSMVTLPQDFGGTQHLEPDAIVENVISLSRELADVISNAGTLFQHHVEFFNLNRAMLYAVPDLLAGYKKAMKVMMREPDYEENQTDPDRNCERIWREEEGYINMRVALWHLERFGCVPELAPGSQPSHPVIAQFYRDKVVSINLVREGPKDLMNWAGDDHAPIDDFEVLLDPGELEMVTFTRNTLLNST